MPRLFVELVHSCMHACNVRTLVASRAWGWQLIFFGRLLPILYYIHLHDFCTHTSCAENTRTCSGGSHVNINIIWKQINVAR